MLLVVSSSFHPDSRSRILAQAACEHLKKSGYEFDFVDLKEVELPVCDGDACYSDPEVIRVASMIKNADGIIVASPIYNYDVNSVIKNLVELTGQAWADKVVGFMCAAGGQGSYMSIMGLANSLMLDFRAVIIPRFVYTTGDTFQGEQVADPDLQERIEQLVEKVVKVSEALK